MVRRIAIAVSATTPSRPPGIVSATNGFATTAVIVYAGTPDTADSLVSGNGHAVSQYDVACFQVSQH
jgi:hypothetical protein